MDNILHFDWAEFFVSKTAAEKGIVNYPQPSEVNEVNRALLALAQHVMDPIRIYIGVPVVITSGYRSEVVNKLVGGVAASQHTRGQACDFTVPSYDPRQMKALYYSLLTFVNFDQMIFYPRKNIIHVSYVSVKDNRHHTFISGAR